MLKSFLLKNVYKLIFKKKLYDKISSQCLSQKSKKHLEDGRLDQGLNLGLLTHEASVIPLDYQAMRCREDQECSILCLQNSVKQKLEMEY